MRKARDIQFHMRTLKWVALIMASLLLLAGIQRLLMPKYMGDATKADSPEGNIVEGAMTAEYYEEEEKKASKNHDLIILGDCEVYENISTEELWKEYGIHSYIRGSAGQTMAQSYYLLKETLSYETPKVVMLSVFAMQEDEVKSETYNRMLYDGMKLSFTKLEAVEATMTEDETLSSYLFPILRYHDRWNQLTREDFTYYWQKKTVTINGYLPQDGVLAASDLPEEIPLGSYDFTAENYEYLDLIRTLCQEKGIQLVLFKAPSLYPAWYEEWEEQIESYASQYDLVYYNTLEKAVEIGIDYGEDTYDGGLHLNDQGAVKLADYLGEHLLVDTSIVSQKENKLLCQEWEAKLDSN